MENLLLVAISSEKQMATKIQGVSQPGGKLSDGKILLSKVTRLQIPEYLLFLF